MSIYKVRTDSVRARAASVSQSEGAAKFDVEEASVTAADATRTEHRTPHPCTTLHNTNTHGGATRTLGGMAVPTGTRQVGVEVARLCGATLPRPHALLAATLGWER